MDVITEILSALSVKSLLPFSCVNKSFDALISDPYFVQKHLKKSKRIPRVAAVVWIDNESSGVVSPKISDLLDSSYRNIVRDRLLAEHLDWSLVGSCNGLLCLNDSDDNYLYIWNPATTSEYRLSHPWLSYNQFSFGYDTSTETYKAVSFGVNYKQGESFQPFPVIPAYKSNGVHLNGIINWLALRDYSNSGYFDLDHRFITDEDYVIISLDLSTDTYIHSAVTSQLNLWF
ncbi:putative F-box domain-containing protein [Medicago truncatula]|uniref:F-box protein interaction domain protein n=1 Tax=Medicago truncatula TaxID=3880 RepID=G7JED7_MEDTR|nr:F-box/kelch-repeat protein At3g23880 [Medicago truncatula]AES86427.1 F-box protein interaction domain protein [Medicago truncatula]RHN58331.1 putative F-box domain-containing protein [Medicago truncatula]